jgi:hypothetical protein
MVVFGAMLFMTLLHWAGLFYLERISLLMKGI